MAEASAPTLPTTADDKTHSGTMSSMATADEIFALLRRIAERRDRTAFDALYSSTSSQLYGIVIRILRRRDLAEDVMQEVYLKIWERAGDFDPAMASPTTWMATIARNRAIDIVRRKVLLSTEEVEGIEDVPVTGSDAAAEAETRDDLRRLQGCMERIEPDRREMVILAYRDGYSREELAERFKAPINSIKTWLHRSLKQLKDCMDT